MAYILPQTLVFQEFNVAPAVVAQSLRPHIAGGHAQLVRFAEADEQANGLLGYYDPLADTEYTWPNRQAGGRVDQTYTKVWAKDALLQYFGTTIGGGHSVTKLTGFNNRVHAGNLSFAANGTAYPRSAAFLDRDVAPGDIVKVRGLASGVPKTTWTYVKKVSGDAVAAVTAAAVADAANKATQSYSASFTKVAGPANAVTIQVAGTLYDGLASGYVTETYDVIVTSGSAGNNYTTAVLRVISGSGTDDQAAVVPAAHNSPTAIGTRGLKVIFTTTDVHGDSVGAVAEGNDPDDLLVGQRWRVTVNQAFTKPVATSSGTYTGAANTTYVVTVTRGGRYSDDDLPQVSVTTADGTDISGPTDVPAAASAVAAGTKGVLIAFSGTALRGGDIYRVAATAAGVGPMRVLELGGNIDSGIAAAAELDLTLFILKPSLQVDVNRHGFAPLVNWEQAEETLTLKAGIPAYDSTWTDGGVPQPLDLVSDSGQGYTRMYAEYRAWLCDLGTTVGGVNDVGALDLAISGPIHPDNPLKYGVAQALANANGSEVKFTAVCDPASDGDWADMLGLLVGRPDTYSLVPLTRRSSVLSLYQAHINAQSSPENAFWRTAWFSLAGVPAIPVVAAGSTVPRHAAATTTDGAVCLCVIEDDPDVGGAQYTILRCTSGNGGFLSNAVTPGDVVRTGYTGDGFGNYTYSEYVVDEVSSEDELRLLTGPAAAVSSGAKVEDWRNLNKDQEAQEVGLQAGAFGSRRVRAVWPDTIETTEGTVDGLFLCCSLAGLAGGILPHQGMTNVAVSGWVAVPRTSRFNRAQLDVMAGAGTWIVAQDPQIGVILNRHAVTTGSNADINAREEMVTRNVDSISYQFKDWFAPYIGVTNVTPIVLTHMGNDFQALLSLLKTESATERLGGQVIDAQLLELRRHATLLDRVVMRILLLIPYATNNIEIHLAV